ncbi:MAG: phage holin family protein [Pseudomonadota bacterium]|nr:phage holin family protein [Pseudomonadota bacterium]
MIAALEYRLRLAVRRTMFGVASGILLFVGVAFLAVAAWIGLRAFLEPLDLALIFGGVFVGLGLIMLAMTRTSRAKISMAPSVNAPMSTVAPMAGIAAAGTLGSAFIQGITAGMAARKTAATPTPPPPGYDPAYEPHPHDLHH